MAKSIKKNFLYNILLNISSVIFPLITAPYVARVLEPAGVGLFNFANTFAGYFALVALLGIPTYGVREVAKRRDDKEGMALLLSQIVSISVMITSVVSLVYLLTIFTVNQLTLNYVVFLIAGFAIYLSPLKINWYYQGIEDFGFITFRTLIIRTLSVISLFVFVREKDDLIIYVIIYVLGNALADIWNFIKLWRVGIHPHIVFQGLKQHIRPLLTLFASSIAISIYAVLDTLMLGFIKDYEEVGYYSNAMHVTKVILSAVTSLSIVAVPRVSYYLKNNEFEKINEMINKSLSVVSFMSFPAAIGLICISSVFVPLFFGEQFAGAIVPMMVLSLLIIAIGLNNLTGIQILIGMGYDKLFLYSVLTGSISNFILNIVFIPLWGGIGASIASVFAETLILFVTGAFVYKHTPVRIRHWMDILKAASGTIVFFPLIYMLKDFYEGWMLVGVFAATSGLSYIILETIMRNSSVEMVKTLILSKISKQR